MLARAAARCTIFMTSGDPVGASERPQKPIPFGMISGEERGQMRKFLIVPAAGIALTAAASVLLPQPGQQALAQKAPQAAAKDTGYFVNIVDLEISPPSMTKFMVALQDDVTGTAQEAGVHEIDSTVGQTDPNHVFIFEAYNNAAAWASHQKTATYAKFVGMTMMMIKNYNIRPFNSVAMNINSAAQPQTSPLYVSVVETDVVPDKVDSFLTAAKANAAAAIGDAGVREFNIAVSQTVANHVLFFEVYDNAAAHDAQAATDHFKAYEATVKDMVTKGSVTPLSSVSMNTKAQ
jgi:(4S)-4-hydroxy-5-phosphonooxypentane-2,3-dione isomerase